MPAKSFLPDQGMDADLEITLCCVSETGESINSSNLHGYTVKWGQNMKIRWHVAMNFHKGYEGHDMETSWCMGHSLQTQQCTDYGWRHDEEDITAYRQNNAVFVSHRHGKAKTTNAAQLPDRAKDRGHDFQTSCHAKERVCKHHDIWFSSMQIWHATVFKFSNGWNTPCRHGGTLAIHAKTMIWGPER